MDHCIKIICCTLKTCLCLYMKIGGWRHHKQFNVKIKWFLLYFIWNDCYDSMDYNILENFKSNSILNF